MRKILSLAIPLAALLSVPATAITEFYHHRDGSVTAFFSIEDPAGCIRTDITVNAWESLTKNGPGPFAPAPGLMVNIDRVDWCGGVFLMSAFGASSDLEILVSPSLTTASVRGRVELYDYVGETASPAEVDLNLTGNRPIIVSTDNNMVYGPYTRTLAHGSSRHREAEVTGAVLQNGVDLAAGAAGKGGIYFEQGGYVMITRDAASATAPLPTSPPVAEGDLFSYRGGSASANFVSIDPTGCITTEIWAGGSDSRERYSAGRFEPVSQVGVNISRIDWCNSVELMRATWDNNFTGSLQISNALQDARLQGSTELYDSIQGIYFTVDVDLTWTGEGPLSGRRDRLFADFPNDRSMSKEIGRSRSAQASGAILYECANLLTGPSQSGSLFFGQGMTLTWR